ncbi:MAG: hypothetical protein I8H71_04325 [Xanthomonadaceae bacterium]|nr:hypothetical protein [Xanthomonadaceae bacterium]
MNYLTAALRIASSDLRLVGMRLRKGQPAVVVHGQEDIAPANVSRALCPIPRDAGTDLLEVSQLLNVDVQQRASGLAFVPDALARQGAGPSAQWELSE